MTDTTLYDVTVDNGKYRIVYHMDAKPAEFYRHGEPWPATTESFAHSNLLMALVAEIDELRRRVPFYLELHITVHESDDFERFRLFGGDKWKASRFSEDDVDDMHGKWFMSARFDNKRDASVELRAMVNALTRSDYNVIRWKIENTELDSKHGSTLDDVKAFMS